MSIRRLILSHCISGEITKFIYFIKGLANCISEYCCETRGYGSLGSSLPHMEPDLCRVAETSFQGPELLYLHLPGSPPMAVLSPRGASPSVFHLHRLLLKDNEPKRLTHNLTAREQLSLREEPNHLLLHHIGGFFPPHSPFTSSGHWGHQQGRCGSYAHLLFHFHFIPRKCLRNFLSNNLPFQFP